jgi:zinc protease
MLEHMMFKGTDKHPAGEFSRIIAENGVMKMPLPDRLYGLFWKP